MPDQELDPSVRYHDGVKGQMTEATQLIQPSPENEMYRPFTVFQPRQLLDVDSEEKGIDNLRRQTPSL
jgi:hypothetical protein